MSYYLPEPDPSVHRTSGTAAQFGQTAEQIGRTAEHFGCTAQQIGWAAEQIGRTAKQIGRTDICFRSGFLGLVTSDGEMMIKAGWLKNLIEH